MEPLAMVEEYLRLGLRLGRLCPSLLDGYTGDPALHRSVERESPPDPAELATAARRLRRGLAETDVEEGRREFLRAQLRAVECSALRLAGRRIPFRAEVRACFQAEALPGEQDSYALAHAELDELLPGRGSLTDRIATLRAADRIPPRALRRCVQTFSALLRSRVRREFGLPEGETVEYHLVSGRPWSGLHRYLGGYRSHVLVSTEGEHRMANLPHLVAHEAYPGHHTQRCRTDRDERVLGLVNTPQCLLAEGLADQGLSAVVGVHWGRWAARVFTDLGMRMDGELAERVEAATRKLRSVRQDAALMLHDRGRDVDEVSDYLCRWLLVPRERAGRMVRFLTDPLWRAYTTTYVEGYRLVGHWLREGCGPAAAGAVPATSTERYLRLIDEPLAPGTLRAELTAAAASGAETHQNGPS